MGRTTGSYFQVQYHRLAARRGSKRVIVAVAHSLLVVAYQLLKTREAYHDLEADYFDQRQREVTAHWPAKRLQTLGYRVILEPVT
jgi:hypothetical protein